MHSSPPSVAIVHVFHWDVWTEVLEPKLQGIPVIVTCPMGTGIRAAIEATRPDVDIYEMPNRGRDWYPFLEILKRRQFPPETLIFKLHTKKSPHYNRGAWWCKNLVASCLGSKAQIAHIHERFEKEPQLGALVHENWFFELDDFMIWNHKWLSRFISVSERSGIQFPGGSMFVARRAAFNAMLKLDLDFDRFEPEPIGIDGHLAHCAERLMGWSIRKAGMKLAGMKLLEPPLFEHEETRSQKKSPKTRRLGRNFGQNLLVFGQNDSHQVICDQIHKFRKRNDLRQVLIAKRKSAKNIRLISMFPEVQFHWVAPNPSVTIAAKTHLKNWIQEHDWNQPIAIFAPGHPEVSGLLKSLNPRELLAKCAKAASGNPGDDAWFGEALETDAESIPEHSPARQYISGLDVRWDFKTLVEPKLASFLLSGRLSQIWLQTPCMPTETEEKRLLALLVAIQTPVVPNSL